MLRRRPRPRRGRAPSGPGGAGDGRGGGRRPLVLVDGRMALRRPTGIATYVNELRAVMDRTPPSDMRVEWVYGPPGLPRLGRLTSLGNMLLDLLWLHVLLPLIALSRRAAVLHTPVNWGPWFSPCPTVVTIHDLSWERIPDAFRPGFRRYASLFARRSVRTARRVIAVSRSTAADLRELYGVPDRRLRVILNGVDPDLRPPGPREPFVLSVGVLEPRKRIAALVEGHARYWEEAPLSPRPCRLVVVGGPGDEEAAVRAAAGPGCEVRGFVHREELLDLYRRAILLVYPSAYEGFGIPVGEAMAHGCPVLAARNSSIEEVGGDAAIYLDEVTPEAIARALSDLLADREALAARGERGRAQAARFSWTAAATATRDVYRQAIEE